MPVRVVLPVVDAEDDGDYSRAKDEMLVHNDIPEAPWNIIESGDKRRARINMIAHLLGTVPYHEVQRPLLELPPRPTARGYVRAPRESQSYVPDHAAMLPGASRADPAGGDTG